MKFVVVLLEFNSYMSGFVCGVGVEWLNCFWFNLDHFSSASLNFSAIKSGTRTLVLQSGQVRIFPICSLETAMLVLQTGQRKETNFCRLVIVRTSMGLESVA